MKTLSRPIDGGDKTARDNDRARHVMENEIDCCSEAITRALEIAEVLGLRKECLGLVEAAVRDAKAGDCLRGPSYSSGRRERRDLLQRRHLLA